jgi:hypothetical protein
MADVLDTQDLKRLEESVLQSRRRLQPLRKNRRDRLRQYVGHRWMDDAASERVPVNMIELMINVYLSLLAGRRPAVLTTTPTTKLKPAAASLELGINQLLGEIDFERTSRMCVLNALVGQGVCKVGRAFTGQTVEWEGFRHDVAQPFADPVDFDDWVQDMNASRYEQISFAGDRYRLPLEMVVENRHYDSTARAKLKTTAEDETWREGEDEFAEIGRGQGEREEFRETVALWDLWLPLDGVIITVPNGGEWDPPLRVAPYEGPESGPYHLLGFAEVPQHGVYLDPLSPCLQDLHDIVNLLYRKLGRQAERQKTVYGYNDEADTTRIKDAADGEAVLVSSPQSGQEMSLGGINRENLAFAVHVKDLFGYLAGNLDLLGGLGAQSPTATQDELLQANASRRLSSMQSRTTGFTTAVVRSLAWYLWEDQFFRARGTKRAHNREYEVEFSPEQREGDYLDYNFTIEPYSMTEKTPGQRLQIVEHLFQNYLIPFAPQIAEVGGAVDWRGFLELYAKLNNMNELNDIMTFRSPPDLDLNPRQREQGGNGGGMPAQTKRTYERVNRSTATRKGQDDVLQNVLLGANKQPDEMAKVGMTTG